MWRNRNPGGHVKWYSCAENQLGNSSELSYGLSIPLLGTYQEKWKYTFNQKLVHKCSEQHDTLQLKSGYPNVSQPIDYQKVLSIKSSGGRFDNVNIPPLNMHFKILAYVYNGILFDHKKKWNTDMCCDTANTEDIIHDVQWKRLVTRDHILYDSIYSKCPAEANLQRQKVDKWLPGAWGRMGNNL